MSLLLIFFFVSKNDVWNSLLGSVVSYTIHCEGSWWLSDLMPLIRDHSASLLRFDSNSGRSKCEQICQFTWWFMYCYVTSVNLQLPGTKTVGMITNCLNWHHQTRDWSFDISDGNALLWEKQGIKGTKVQNQKFEIIQSLLCIFTFTCKH